MSTTGAPRKTRPRSLRQPDARRPIRPTSSQGATDCRLPSAACRFGVPPIGNRQSTIDSVFLSASISRMPTSREIYLRRLDTIRSRLRALSADALFVTPSSNLYYLTGIDFHRSERLTALFLFPDLDPVVICPGRGR